MLNLHGNGLFGKVNVVWDSTLIEIEPGYWEYVYNRTDERQFYFKDHPCLAGRRVGSIRMTLDENSDIVSAQDYYPYGEILRSYTLGSGANDKYKFTEKERDTETNYDYFGARYYDSDLARWLQIDPLADKYPGWSPYNYTLNNPLNYFDPDGKFAIKSFERYGTFFTVINSSWAVNWSVYGLWNVYSDDNIFPKSEPISEKADNIKFAWALNQFDRIFGTLIGAIKSGYDFLHTVAEANDVFYKWKADKILIEQISNDKIGGVNVFIKKELSESQIQYNRTGYSFLNGFIWLEFNPEIFSKKTEEELIEKYELKRDIIADQLKINHKNTQRHFENTGNYKYGGYYYYRFNDTYHPRNN